jgi:hypothetical protein
MRAALLGVVFAGTFGLVGASPSAAFVVNAGIGAGAAAGLIERVACDDACQQRMRRPRVNGAAKSSTAASKGRGGGRAPIAVTARTGRKTDTPTRNGAANRTGLRAPIAGASSG